MKILIILIFACGLWAQPIQPPGGMRACSATVTTNCAVNADSAGNVKVGNTVPIPSGAPAGSLAATKLYGDGSAITGVAGSYLYSIASYGAIGDGSTDDTASINSAIAAAVAAGGGTVCSPAGKIYRINGQIVMPNDGGSPIPRQKPVTFTTCGEGGTQWQYDGPGGVAQNGMATWDMRYNGDGGKLTSLGIGAIKISGLGLVDNASPTSYTQTGGTLVSIAVSANSATATFSAPPGGGKFKGASWEVAGSTTTALNGKYKVTAFFGATITFKTVGVGNGIYNNGALLMRYSAPFVYDTGTTLTMRDVYMRGNASLTQNGVVFGGMTASANGTIDSGFQGYGSDIDHSIFTWMGTPIVLQTWANNISVRASSWVHNTGLQAIECDGSVDGADGPTQNMFTADTIEMDTYKYAVTLDWCTNSTFDLKLEDVGSVTSLFFFGSSGSSNGNRFEFTRAGTNQIATGNLANDNSYIAEDGAKAAVIAVAPAGTLSSQFPKGISVGSVFPRTGSSGAIPGGVMSWDLTDMTKYIAMGYDVSDDRGIVDVYNYSAGAPRILLLNPSGGRVEVGSSLVGVSAIPVAVGTGCTATIGAGSTNLAGTITITGTPGACSVVLTWNLLNTYGSRPAHGFGCNFQNMTTPANGFGVTAYSVTATTIAGAIFATNDVILYSGCTGF